MTLVLSLFPGLDVLGMGFEREGFSVVAGPDVVLGRDVREFHPPAGRFDGIIGGPPCQTFSTLANLVRAKGLEPRFGNLIPEFVRCVEEAAPAWFLMENVAGVPEEDWPRPEGYAVHGFILENAQLDAGNGFGEEQMRKRRIWFGWTEDRGPAPDLRSRLRFCALMLPRAAQATVSDARAVPVKIGGSGKLKRRHEAVTGRSGKPRGSGSVSRLRASVTQSSVNNAAEKKRRPSVTGAHPCHERPKGGHGEGYSLEDMLHLQGLGPEILDHAPFTKTAMRKLIGNAVPLGMARQLAAAVRDVMAEAAIP